MNRNQKIYSLLKKNYPDAKIALNYSNNWQLLVAIILSAQCRDDTVNKVTKELFKKYPNINNYFNLDIKILEKLIKSTGFYRNKAKNIISLANKIRLRFDNIIPNNIDQLVKLPGIARKTANVFLGNAYDITSGIAVDTHVSRLAQRLGLSNNKNTDKIEKDLMNIFPKKYWLKLTYLLIEHGRSICNAKAPKCKSCFLKTLCPSAANYL
jgi:endonuclease-3